MDEKIALEIEGLGIILYSDFAVKDIENDEDYFTENYNTPEDVVKHIESGTIVGFCTGSPGKYILNFKEGYPSEQESRISDLKLRLGIEVRDNRICIKDLYDLLEWSKDEEKFIKIENGFYHITLCGNIPVSGIIGDDQWINIYLKRLDSMPKLRYTGVPMFCKPDN
ncbi:hypothetical protein E4V42_09350 [Clostridium estertheticum]|uniref:Uncharacterized protein n=1 Tax=Clostridium estertheticum TaxID=238834 RepID=A0A5N7J8C7_9CLOT|nr:hypothetical protein [Clostridium estertheticum]MPQ31644.1 hypothetical protein [Clostridium estertheticum]MPQ64962.1 hypothetical protein [Clostridium estertheticum]